MDYAVSQAVNIITDLLLKLKNTRYSKFRESKGLCYRLLSVCFLLLTMLIFAEVYIIDSLILFV